MFAHELNLLVIGYAASQLGPDPIQTSSFTPCSHSRACNDLGGQRPPQFGHIVSACFH